MIPATPLIDRLRKTDDPLRNQMAKAILNRDAAIGSLCEEIDRLGGDSDTLLNRLKETLVTNDSGREALAEDTSTP